MENEVVAILSDEESTELEKLNYLVRTNACVIHQCELNNLTEFIDNYFNEFQKNYLKLTLMWESLRDCYNINSQVDLYADFITGTLEIIKNKDEEKIV